MQSRPCWKQEGRKCPVGSASRPWRIKVARACAGLITVAFLTEIALVGQTPQQPPPRAPKPIILPEANRPPDANEQMAMHERQARQRNFDAANAERIKQISEDSAKLLNLAADLHAAVDKTNKETLSLTAVREVGEIERLAHNVQEKMKLTAPGN